MLDWSKFKSINNKLYSPRGFSFNFILTILVITIVSIDWLNSSEERSSFGAIFHALFALIVVCDFIRIFLKYGKYGIPVVEIDENSILVREYGRFKENIYKLSPGDKLYIVGKPERKHIRIESLNGESSDILFFGLNGSTPIELISNVLSKRMAVFFKDYPIEPV